VLKVAMGNWIDLITSQGEQLLGSFWPLVWNL